MSKWECQIAMKIILYILLLHLLTWFDFDFDAHWIHFQNNYSKMTHNFSFHSRCEFDWVWLKRWAVFFYLFLTFFSAYLCNSSNITFKSIFNNCFKDVHRLILCFTLITWMQLLNILLNHSKSQLKIIFFDDQTWFARMHESKHKNALNQTFIFIHKVRQLLKSLFRLFLFQCQYIKG